MDVSQFALPWRVIMQSIFHHVLVPFYNLFCQKSAGVFCSFLNWIVDFFIVNLWVFYSGPVLSQVYVLWIFFPSLWFINLFSYGFLALFVRLLVLESDRQENCSSIQKKHPHPNPWNLWLYSITSTMDVIKVMEPRPGGIFLHYWCGLNLVTQALKSSRGR